MGQIPVFEALVAAGANVYAKDFDGVTLLMTAASEGHVDLARWVNAQS